MKNRLLLFLFLLLFAGIGKVVAACQNESWNRVGKIYLTRPAANNAYVSDYSNTVGVLYEKFDGVNLVYKLYVPADDSFYAVRPNPDYDKGKVETYNYNQNRYNNYRGPSPKIIEQYPQKAGSYYLDVGNTF